MRTEDGYIIHKCLDGDTEAFGFLVDKYKGGVYALAYARLRDFHHAEDVSQEVFIKAYEKLNTLKRWDSFASWLYRIATNFCNEWIRVASKRPEYEFIGDQPSMLFDKRALDSYRDERLFESLHEALESLSEDHRQVLTLHYLGDMTSYEIARFVGVSSAAVRKRLSKARSMLRDELLVDMGTTLQQNKLPAIFTLRTIETVKRIKVNPIQIPPGLPWGASIAMGIILILLGLSAHPDLPNPLHLLIDSSPPSQMAASRDGEIPVDLLSFPLMSTPLQEDDRTSDAANSTKKSTYVDSDVLISNNEQAAKGNVFPKYPTVRLGRESLYSIAYSPDGRMLAAGGMDKVWLYDAYSLTEIGLLQGHRTLSGIISIAFSSDGKILASGGINDSIRIWDIRKRKQIGALPKSDKAFTTSPDL